MRPVVFNQRIANFGGGAGMNGQALEFRLPEISLNVFVQIG